MPVRSAGIKKMLDLENLRQKARRLARRRWMQHHLRDISDNDNHLGLERLYRLDDPWNLDSPLEHARFEATNRVIEHNFGKVGDLLEIGCGEGFQSTYLQRLCDRLHGVEVSATALERARKRLPDAQLSLGDLTQQNWVAQRKRFDLIVACEVLYYVKDVRGTMELMNQLGDACLISFFAPEAHKLTALVEEMPRAQKGWFVHDGVTWLMAWWRNREKLGVMVLAALSLLELTCGELLQLGGTIAAVV
jgi:protein-L-isoaspartate O-methyltransferase